MRFAILVCLPACAGIVVRPPAMDERPRWRITGEDTLDADCVIARALVRKSGKQGIGVTLALRSRFDCDLRITRAELVFPDGARVAAALPTLAPMRGRSLAYQWLAFRFDGDAAWDRGAHEASLELDFLVGGEAASWRVPAALRWGARWHNQLAGWL